VACLAPTTTTTTTTSSSQAPSSSTTTTTTSSTAAPTSTGQPPVTSTFVPNWFRPYNGTTTSSSTQAPEYTCIQAAEEPPGWVSGPYDTYESCQEVCSQNLPTTTTAAPGCSSSFCVYTWSSGSGWTVNQNNCIGGCTCGAAPTNTPTPGTDPTLQSVPCGGTPSTSPPPSTSTSTTCDPMTLCGGKDNCEYQWISGHGWFLISRCLCGCTCTQPTERGLIPFQILESTCVDTSQQAVKAPELVELPENKECPETVLFTYSEMFESWIPETGYALYCNCESPEYTPKDGEPMTVSVKCDPK
jgi:hypothetical protein